MGNNISNDPLTGNWTAGRWVAGFGHQHAFRVYHESLEGAKIADFNCVGGVPTGLEAEANTQLAAAAPDLYISLLAIEEYILQDQGYAEGTVNRALQDAALEALAKARGEENKQ